MGATNLQPLTWGLTIPLAIITTASCFLRFYARAGIAKAFGKDDWMMVVAWIWWVGDQVCLWAITAAGGGKPQSEVDADHMFTIQVWLFTVEFVYTITQFFIKMSFLLFFLRVLATTKRYRDVCYFVVGLNVFQTVSILLLYALQCIPIDAFFHPTKYDHPFCMSTGLTLYLPSGLNVAVDTVIYLLPIYPLLNLQMPLRRRLELIAVFTLGGGTVLVTLLRFMVLHQLAQGREASMVYGSVVIVTTVEFSAAIMTANMPGLQAVWKKHISKSLESNVASGSNNHELGSVSAVRSRKVGRGSQVLRSQDPSNRYVDDNASEEELFTKDNNIVVSTQVDVTSARTEVDEKGPKAYYQFSQSKPNAQ